jgi:hypothetical protein
MTKVSVADMLVEMAGCGCRACNAIRRIIEREPDVVELARLTKEAIRYFRHVQRWSTHGPADISSECLADELAAILARFEEEA